MKSAQQLKSDLEDLKEVMEINRDMLFIYKGRQYYLSFGKNEKGETVRGFFEYPEAYKSILLFKDKNPGSIKLDGKSLFELIEEIEILGID